jgi:hypothetical protein
MHKEMPVILVNRVVDSKNNNQEKMEDRGGEEAQGVADQKTGSIVKNYNTVNFIILIKCQLPQRDFEAEY